LECDEVLKEILPVDIVPDLLAPASAAHDVVHRAGVLDAQLARQGKTLLRPRIVCQEMNHVKA
jgi:hypothetical protein